jgi:cbb3-type cytochrome oxidase subunit 3
MTALWITIGILLLIVWVLTAVDIFRRHLGPGRTAAWLLLALILPFVGALLYWARRRPSRTEAQAQYDAGLAVRDELRRRPVGGTGLPR